jgi:2-succinyl-5-enolpyruvyl-6-hydroxy-3-cyclohexene-1-carboxylate synthase
MSSIASLASAAMVLTNSRASLGELLAAHAHGKNPRDSPDHNISISRKLEALCHDTQLILSKYVGAQLQARRTISATRTLRTDGSTGTEMFAGGSIQIRTTSVFQAEHRWTAAVSNRGA